MVPSNGGCVMLSAMPWVPSYADVGYRGLYMQVVAIRTCPFLGVVLPFCDGDVIPLLY